MSQFLPSLLPMPPTACFVSTSTDVGSAWAATIVAKKAIAIDLPSLPNLPMMLYKLLIFSDCWCLLCADKANHLPNVYTICAKTTNRANTNSGNFPTKKKLNPLSKTNTRTQQHTGLFTLTVIIVCRFPDGMLLRCEFDECRSTTERPWTLCGSFYPKWFRAIFHFLRMHTTQVRSLSSQSIKFRVAVCGSCVYKSGRQTQCTFGINIWW